MARWSFSSVLIYSLFRVCPWRQDDYSYKRLSRWQKGLSFFLFTMLTQGNCSGNWEGFRRFGRIVAAYENAKFGGITKSWDSASIPGISAEVVNSTYRAFAS
jgi:hypothetical protein